MAATFIPSPNAWLQNWTNKGVPGYQPVPVQPSVAPVQSQFDISGGNASTAPVIPVSQSGSPQGSINAANYRIGGDLNPGLQPSAPNVQLGQQPTDIMQMLQKILQNPGDVASNPAYKFLQDQGQQALDRTLGANGQRFSGNAMTAAQQYGQGLAGQYFGQLANTLGNAAQTQLSTYLQPAAAQAGLNLGSYNAQNSAWNNLASNMLGNYQANIGNAGGQNQANLGATSLNNQIQSSQQGYGALMPTVQRILQQLQLPQTYF